MFYPKWECIKYRAKIEIRLKENQKYVACFFLFLRFNFFIEIGGLKYWIWKKILFNFDLFFSKKSDEH